jgi:hypothetical protein
VGVLTVQDALANVINCSFSLAESFASFFAIAGNQVVTGWTGLATPGSYSVRISAIGTDTPFSNKVNCDHTYSRNLDNGGRCTRRNSARGCHGHHVAWFPIRRDIDNKQHRFFRCIWAQYCHCPSTDTPADDGTHATSITASQGSQSLSTGFSI